MKQSFLLFLVGFLVFSCAQEDPNIVNPPPGNANIIVRLFNMVPDDNSRSMALELGYKTASVFPGRMSATIQAPSDSSFIEILNGTTQEYYSIDRYRFVRQSVYDVFAVAGHFTPEVFDTVFLSNANISLTTLPVAQVRLVNTVPDTSITFDLRQGCPNGSLVNQSTVSFRNASLYREVNPGDVVFSIVENRVGGSVVLGTFECLLKERTPYSVIAYRNRGSNETQLMLLDEADFTVTSDRSLLPISARTADVRVVNVSTTSVSVTHQNTSDEVATNLASGQISSFNALPTCESELSDVFAASFSTGTTSVDSISLTVREKYSIVCADSGSVQNMLIVPPAPTVFGAGGMSIIRVVNLSTSYGNLVVSSAARTDATQSVKFNSGATLADNVQFKGISTPIAVAAGQIPITVSTAAKPTKFLNTSRLTTEPDRHYILILSELNGNLIVNVVDEEVESSPVPTTTPAMFIRVLNGSPARPSEVADVQDIINGGILFYRNSLTTTVLSGSNTVQIGGASTVLNADPKKRELTIYGEGGNSPNIFSINSDPMAPTPGLSMRRFINATADIPLVSVAFDSVPAQTPDAEHLARDIAYGTTSGIYNQDRDRRGSIYFYDSASKKELFSLPIDFGPLGNNYSLVVVGRNDSGYEVIVAQEF